MTYRCIDHLQTKAINIASLCRVLTVSHSGYYAARARSKSPRRSSVQARSSYKLPLPRLDTRMVDAVCTKSCEQRVFAWGDTGFSIC